MAEEFTDCQLIERFLKDDICAFDILYDRYKRQLYAYIHRLLPGQHSLCDDIFQQTWIKIIQQLGRYRDDEKFLAWAMRISHNLTIDYFRKHRHESVEDFSDPQNTLSDTDSDSVVWEDIDKGTIDRALEDCLEKLPTEQREVFLLRQQDISFKEIAVIQNCSINTALGRMRYAMQSLQSCLSKWKDG